MDTLTTCVVDGDGAITYSIEEEGNEDGVKPRHALGKKRLATTHSKT